MRSRKENIVEIIRKDGTMLRIPYKDLPGSASKENEDITNKVFNTKTEDK